MSGDTLWGALAELSVPADGDESRLRCVHLVLEGGATFDVYRAEEREGGVTLWSVRGFHEQGGATRERKCAVLGTKDGRAMVRFDDSMSPVASHEARTRSLSDLSAVVAAAIRRLMGPDPDAN